MKHRSPPLVQKTCLKKNVQLKDAHEKYVYCYKIVKESLKNTPMLEYIS